MTDNEILRALMCLAGKRSFCNECQDRTLLIDLCKKKAAEEAAELIYRQRIEISRLANENLALSQAIREFAERMKKLVPNFISWGFGDIHNKIDNIAKEITER